MPISWKTSDGNTGIAENDYEFAMQHFNTSTKGDREELAPQDRINQAFGEGPAAPEIKDQNAPYSWGMGDDLKDLGVQPDAPADEWQKAYGDKRAGEFIPVSAEQSNKSNKIELTPQQRIDQAFDEPKDQNNPLHWGLEGVIKRRNEIMTSPEQEGWSKEGADEIRDMNKQREIELLDVPASMKERLAAFQQRLDATPPEEAGAFRKFLGSLNIMPAPGKPESEWTAKEHFGVLLNTAMAGMGGGIRGPGIVSPGNFKTALSKAGPAANMNRESYQINPTPYEEAQLEASWKALGKDLSKPDLKVIEGGKGLTTETEPQLQQAQHGGSIEQVSNPAIRIEGEVYHAPGTHGNAYMKAIEAYGQGAKIPKGEEGFITTHGRFVDRVEAGEIALKAQQVGLRVGRLDTDNFDPAPPPKTTEWPEGWGTKLPEGKRILSASDYPHVQKAFKEAVEQGNKTSSEVSDYILEKHGIDLSSYMVKRLQETSGIKLEDSAVNATNSGWTPELIGKLKEGFDKGKSFQTLADELGQSRGQVAGKVSRLLKEGVLVDRPTMTSGVEANPEKMARFKELRSKGLSYKEIAQDLNITTSYARVIASRNKL